MNEKILNIVTKIKENKKNIFKLLIVVVGLIVLVIIINNIQRIRKENSIPMKDRYIAPPTPTITKSAPDPTVSVQSSTTKKTSDTKNPKIIKKK
jgi:hypothetical protein